MTYEIDTRTIDALPLSGMFQSANAGSYEQPTADVGGVSFGEIPTWCIVIAATVVVVGSLSTNTPPVETPPIEHVSLALPDTHGGPIKLTTAQAQLARIRDLKVDWDEIGSEPPNRIAMEVALRVLKSAERVPAMQDPTDVTVSADGGVGIVYKDDQHYAALECLNNGTIWMLWFDGNDPRSTQVEESDVEIQSTLTRIAALRSANA
jgi:hypothetical protein